MTVEGFVIIAAGLFGAMLGSFLNVCILRWPAEQSVVSPRSRCPGCEQLIAWYDNIPVFSWVVLLRGRCRRCKTSISLQYPLVELATALIWAFMAWRFGPSVTALAGAVFFTILLGITMTDAREYIIPNEFNFGGLALGILFSLPGGFPAISHALIGAVAGYGILWAVGALGTRIFKEEAMGGGDIKMMAMVGAFVGWQGVLLTIFLGALIGTLVFVPLTLLGRKRLVPFGVFLSLGAAVHLARGPCRDRVVPDLRAPGMTRHTLAVLALLMLGACRGRPPVGGEAAVAQLVDSLVPAVEKVTGLTFRSPPRSAVRSREQLRAYVLHKLDQELPAEKARGLQASYRLLGLFPDSLDLRALLLELYTEQIVGYYEPDSTMLFVVANADPTMLRVVVSHELVHALQHQYLPLDSIMRQTGDNDRLAAAQSILEGQATLGGMQVVVPDQNLWAMPEFWETYREQFRTQQRAMPVFAKAPRILRESLIFPYLGGADFLRWWAGSEHRDSQPFGALMPVSTEQILHPERYGRGDRPITLRFVSPEPRVLYEDVMGEFDMQLLAADLAQASPSTEIFTPLALGWGGDRFRVYETPGGAAMVWYVAWDDSTSRTRFQSTSGLRLESRRRLGYRMELTSLTIGEHPGTRIVIAPENWLGWKQIGAVEVVK